MRKQFAFSFFLFIGFSCTSFAQGKFDYGKIEKEVYKNKYFDLEIPLPKDWVVQNKEQMEQLTELGKEAITDDENMQALIDAAEVNSAYLLTLFKYEVGAPVNSNLSFMVIAENTKNFPGIKTGKDYLFHAGKLMLATKLDYTIEDEFPKKKIGSKDFYALSATLKIGDKVVYQQYMTTVLNGFSLSIVVSYSDDAEKQELFSTVEKIKI